VKPLSENLTSRPETLLPLKTYRLKIFPENLAAPGD